MIEPHCGPVCGIYSRNSLYIKRIASSDVSCVLCLLKHNLALSRSERAGQLLDIIR